MLGKRHGNALNSSTKIIGWPACARMRLPSAPEALAGKRAQRKGSAQKGRRASPSCLLKKFRRRAFSPLKPRNFTWPQILKASNGHAAIGRSCRGSPSSPSKTGFVRC